MSITLKGLKLAREFKHTDQRHRASIKLHRKVLPWLFKHPVGMFFTDDFILLEVAKDFGLLVHPPPYREGYKYSIEVPK